MTDDPRVSWLEVPPTTTHEGIVPTIRKNAAAAKKDAVAQGTTAAPAAPAKPKPPTKPPTTPPRAPHARPLFADEGGTPMQGAIAVLAVGSRYEAQSGELAGLPRALELLGTFATSSHTAAAAQAREAGLLTADGDALTGSVRFVSAVEVPRADAAPADALPEGARS